MAEKTDSFVVTEAMEFTLVADGIRQVQVNFKVPSAAGKTQAESDAGAVVVWDVLETLPERPENLLRRAVANRTPYTIEFDPAVRGKKVYVALAWQNQQGVVGKWSEIQWAIVP